MSKQTFFATLKEAKEQCKSYYEANGQLRNCTCGTCPTKPTMKSDWREPKSAETKSASTVNAETSNYVYVDWKELYKDEIKEMLSLQKSKLIEEVETKINDFSSSEHNDNEVEKNISRGVGLLKNYLLRELKLLKE